MKPLSGLAMGQMMVIPPFVRKDSSLILRELEHGVAINPGAVDVLISFPTTEWEKQLGMEQELHHHTISVQPELKVPPSPDKPVFFPSK